MKGFTQICWNDAWFKSHATQCVTYKIVLKQASMPTTHRGNFSKVYSKASRLIFLRKTNSPEEAVGTSHYRSFNLNPKKSINLLIADICYIEIVEVLFTRLMPILVYLT